MEFSVIDRRYHLVLNQPAICQMYWFDKMQFCICDTQQSNCSGKEAFPVDRVIHLCSCFFFPCYSPVLNFHWCHGGKTWLIRMIRFQLCVLPSVCLSFVESWTTDLLFTAAAGLFMDCSGNSLLEHQPGGGVRRERERQTDRGRERQREQQLQTIPLNTNTQARVESQTGLQAY